MRRVFAILGSIFFLLIAPGTVTGVIPWAISHWRMQPPLLGAGFSSRDRGLVHCAGHPHAAGFICQVRAAGDRDAGAGVSHEASGGERTLSPCTQSHVRRGTRSDPGPGVVTRRCARPGLRSCGLVDLSPFCNRLRGPTLRKRFASEYDAYRASVPRWIPRLSPWGGEVKREL